MQEAYKEGQKAEPKIIERLRMGYGWEPLDELELMDYGTISDNGQLEIELKVGSKAVVRCHPDGVFRRVAMSTTALMEDYGDDCQVGELRVGEVKCLGKSMIATIENGGLEVMPAYAWQYSIECAVTGLPGLYVIGWKHEDKRDDDDHRVLDPDKELIKRFYEPPYGLGQIKARVTRLLAMIEKGDVGACTYKQYPCSMWEYHDDDDPMWQKVEGKSSDELGIDEEVAKDLASAGRRLVDAGKLKKQEEDKATDMRGRIDKLIANAGIVVPKEGVVVKGVRIRKGSRRGNVDWKGTVEKLTGAKAKDVEGEKGVKRGAGSEWWEAEIVPVKNEEE